MPKLNSFKFQDGKVFWLPEYPENKPVYPVGYDEDDECYSDYDNELSAYDQAVDHSLASAIEVAPEDMEEIRLMVVKNIYRDGLGQGVKITSMTQPLPGKVYSAECEIETKYQLRNMANNGWIKVSRSHYKFAISDESFKDGKDYRQVACLNPKYEKAGRPENYPWPAKEPEKAAGKWRVESSTSPIADTGDYFTQLWLTNGIVNLHSEKDDNETELQAIADQLNQNKPA